MRSNGLEMINIGASSKVMVYGRGEQRVAIKMVSSVNKKECQLLRN
jgi:hypothetical protein